MVLNIFAMLFVLGVTFVNSIYGAFSGIINMFCTIVAAVVTFAFFEPLNGMLSAQGLHSSYSEPIAFILLFVVTLIALRAAADNLIRGNVRVPMYVDWGVGALCGFVIAQICVGMLLMGFLMLPWGEGRVAMFSRVERVANDEINHDTNRVKFEPHSILPRSDEFTFGMIDTLSRGSLSSGNPIDTVYPDFPRWIFWTTNTTQHASLTSPLRDKEDGFKKGLSVERWWEQKGGLPENITRYRQKNPSKEDDKPNFAPLAYKTAPGNKLIGMRLKLDTSAADRDGASYYHHLRSTQIRLVGEVGDTTRDYIPQVLGGASSKLEDRYWIVDIDNNVGVPNAATLDVFFEVPDNFKPRFVEYRRHARAAVEPAQFAEKPPSDRLNLASTLGAGGEGGTSAGGSTGGARNFLDTIVSDGGTGPVDDLPFPLATTALRSEADVTLENDLFVTGRFSGDRTKFEPTDNTQPRVRKIKQSVPGHKLIQIKVKARAVQSLPGSVLNFAAFTVNQYNAIDKAGDSHPLAGYYAIVKRSGKDYIEFYLAGKDDPGNRQMLDFKEIKRQELEADDAVLCLMFWIPNNKCLTGIKSQGGTTSFGTEICAPAE